MAGEVIERSAWDAHRIQWIRDGKRRRKKLATKLSSARAGGDAARRLGAELETIDESLLIWNREIQEGPTSA